MRQIKLGIEDAAQILNYDGPITYSKGHVSLSLPEDLHNWIMENIAGKKWKRAEFIRTKLRILMENQFLNPNQIIIQKSHTKSLNEIKNEINIKKLKKLSEAERKELERKEALIGVNEELKELFSKKIDSLATS
jgi:hypothetical protein